jgi:hypothetical protein
MFSNGKTGKSPTKKLPATLNVVSFLQELTAAGIVP